MSYMKKNLLYFTKKYLENRPPFFGLIRPIEANFMYQNKKKFGNKILDFGCGDGFFANLVFINKEITVGLDVLESRIDEAKDKKCYQQLQKYDGLKIPFKTKSFSGVFSNSVLEHVPSSDLGRNLAEIHRVLQPGGYFLTTVMTANWDTYLLGRKIFGPKYNQWMRKNQVHYNLLTDKQWQKKFEKAGFLVEKKSEYLHKIDSRRIEIWHYLSFLSKLSYLLFQDWVPWKNWYKLFSIDKKFEKNLHDSFTTDTLGSALFFVLKKN